jgi:protein SERAC1
MHKATNNFWPQMQLPLDLPKARIFSFGYDADIVRAFNTVSSNTLRDHGNTLANELGRRRMRSKSRDRPILFVAHSLGGLVVEQVRFTCLEKPFHINPL